MRDLAILLVLVHACFPEVLALFAELPETLQVATIVWHTLLV